MTVTEDDVWEIWNVMVNDHEEMNTSFYYDDDAHELRSSEGQKADEVMSLIESLIAGHFKKGKSK